MKKQNLKLGTKMKSLFVMLLFISFSQDVFAQKNNIQVTKFSEGKFSLEYERALNSRISLLIGYKKFDAKQRKNFTKKGQRINGEIRWYLTDKNDALTGVYLGPNFSTGKHKVTYYKKVKIKKGSSLLDIFLSKSGDIIHRPVYKYFTGNKYVDLNSIGIKIGYKATIKILSLDCGININRNFASSNSKRIELDQGGYADFNSDINGVRPEIYFGVGFSF